VLPRDGPRSLVVGYAFAMARARAELKELAADLADEVAELHRELAKAKAELARLKAIDGAARSERDPGQPVN